MNYCEKCKIVEDNEYCSVCGRKNREVSDDDFCFLVKASESFGEMFEDVLRRESIPWRDCALRHGRKLGFGIEAGKLQNLRAFSLPAEGGRAFE